MQQFQVTATFFIYLSLFASSLQCVQICVAFAKTNNNHYYPKVKRSYIANRMSSALQAKVPNSDDIIAAPSPGGNDELKSFVADSQRALLTDGFAESKLEVTVNLCGSLKDMLSSRTSVDLSNGMVRVVVHAFVEPNWKRANHISSGGTPLLFTRDGVGIISGNDAAQAVLEKLQESPIIALKLIRREAIEEILSDQSDDAAPDSGGDVEYKNRTGPGSGDADAARKINELAIARASGLGTGVDLTDGPISCRDDAILDTSDATTRFVQSRVAYSWKEEKTGKVALLLQSPSLVTPISGVRSRGSGCTFCKVVAPRTIIDSDVFEL